MTATAEAMPRWSGTPLIRVAADGLAWNVLLETGDRYLDRYTLPMSTELSADELRGWRHRTQYAWAGTGKETIAGQQSR